MLGSASDGDGRVKCHLEVEAREFRDMKRRSLGDSAKKCFDRVVVPRSEKLKSWR